MRHCRATILAFAVLTAGGGVAAADPATQARHAVEKLDAAALALTKAPHARDRVRALIKTVQAYEAGLSALRAGQRLTAARESELRESLMADEARLSRLLGALQAQQSAPEAMTLLHPSGPVATARAGMLLAQATPALQHDVQQLRDQLTELRALQAVQASAKSNLTKGLAGAQDARAALTFAMADRSDLPPRFAADPAAISALLDSSETLGSFATSLSAIRVSLPEATPQRFKALKGTLPPPVRGSVLRAFNDEDAAGVRRPGLILSTAAQALVTAPVAATVRYSGPLLDYGNVIILEPETPYLIVLAGVGHVYAQAGQVLATGDALALMGQESGIAQGFDPEIAQGGGNPAPETLYIEVREGNTPLDPSEWFKLNKD